ncbi:MAG: ribosome small subunit-dependent GTPase A, partial [Oscillospiraceae bacterium]
LKGIGGFYYVKTADGVLECRAKGILRRRGITPLAGDIAEFEGDESGFVISNILARENFFVRPPIANVGCFVLVVSSIDPRPNLQVLDELCAVACHCGVEPVIALTKTDLSPATDAERIYSGVGFETVDVRRDQRLAHERICELARGRIAVFVGNSGVGKSTLINELLPQLSLETGETSKKLGRGRHTTRAVELYELGDGYLADTPGFSSLDIVQSSPIPKKNLAACFPDIERHAQGCRYTGCSHTVEKDCAVLAALARGEIEKSRHESYCAMYDRAAESASHYR